MPALPAREMRVCLCMCMPVSSWVCLCVCVRAGPQVGGCPRRAFVAVGQEHRRPRARACAQCPLPSIWAAEWQWAWSWLPTGPPPGLRVPCCVPAARAAPSPRSLLLQRPGEGAPALPPSGPCGPASRGPGGCRHDQTVPGPGTWTPEQLPFLQIFIFISKQCQTY